MLSGIIIYKLLVKCYIVAGFSGNVRGSHKAQIGEVGLSHRGILFFDVRLSKSITVCNTL